jgi:hypothetical protein
MAIIDQSITQSNKGFRSWKPLRRPNASVNYGDFSNTKPSAGSFEPLTNEMAFQNQQPIIQEEIVNIHSPVGIIPSLGAKVCPILPSGARQPGGTRLGLPIAFHQDGAVIDTVLACADTGADVNIMSDDLARRLGYEKQDTLSDRMKFVLANGKIIESVGRIEAMCSFGVDTSPATLMACTFYVLLKVASSMIMGFDFLETTKTMVEHRERLVPVPRSAFQALSITCLGRPQRRMLTCELNHTTSLALPDTGSNIDLISPSFASERALTVYPGEHLIEIGDGSKAIVDGYVRAKLSIASANTSDSTARVECDGEVELYLLEGAIHDITVGCDTVEELKVYTENQRCLVSGSNELEASGLSHIRCLGPVDKILKGIKKRIARARPRDEEAGACMNPRMQHALNALFMTER